MRTEELVELLDARHAAHGELCLGITPYVQVVLDIELKAVDSLGIRKDLSKPATYILDKAGHVRFAYVGKSLSDRPSIKAILKQLDTLKEEPG